MRHGGRGSEAEASAEPATGRQPDRRARARRLPVPWAVVAAVSTAALLVLLSGRGPLSPPPGAGPSQAPRATRKDLRRPSPSAACRRLQPAAARRCRPRAGGLPAASGAHGSAAPLSFGPWAAGYVAYAPPGRRFSGVAAAFILPPRPAPGVPRGAWIAIWTGIGLRARGGGDLLQAGVSLQAEGPSWGVIAPWWIDEPARPTPPHALPLTLHPGDRIQVSVQLADPRTNTWVLSVTDQTTDVGVDAWCAGCPSARESAGWLVEDPSNGTGYTPFADPGQVTFAAAWATLDGGAPTPLDRIGWRPVYRAPGTSRLAAQGPLGPPAASNGAFVIADLADGGRAAGAA
jgi:hypothetical protein